MRALPSLFIALAMTGCASYKSPPDSAYSLREFQNEKPVGRDSTVARLPASRGGAAYRPEGYEQVVGFRAVGEVVDVPVATEAAPAVTDPLGNAAAAATRKSYSAYELRRWERFCGSGKMDERDWAFVTKEGRNSLPEFMLLDCNEPTFNEADYRTAWKTICTPNHTISASQRAILDKTLPPKNHCSS
jgi:hypothetical protein